MKISCWRTQQRSAVQACIFRVISSRLESLWPPLCHSDESSLSKFLTPHWCLTLWSQQWKLRKKQMQRRTCQNPRPAMAWHSYSDTPHAGQNSPFTSLEHDQDMDLPKEPELPGNYLVWLPEHSAHSMSTMLWPNGIVKSGAGCTSSHPLKPQAPQLFPCTLLSSEPNRLQDNDDHDDHDDHDDL